MKKFKNFLKNYKTMLILILAMIIGAICGLIFKEDAMVVKPLGDLFLNLIVCNYCTACVFNNFTCGG